MARPHKLDDFPPIFTREEALQHGFTTSQLKRKGLKLTTRGVYQHKNVTPSYTERAIAITRSMPHAVVSSLTAAKIQGMRVPSGWDAHQTLYFHTTAHQQIRRPGMVHLRSALDGSEYRHINGYNITTVQRTFLDLGLLLSPRELVCVADGLFAYHRTKFLPQGPLIQKEELLNYLSVKKFHRGKKKCLEALMHAVVGSVSHQETELRLVLASHGITGLAANPVIRDEQGNYICEPDLADVERKISIQYEGAHHGDIRQVQRDEARRVRTEKFGWKEIRVFASDLYALVHFQGQVIPRAVEKVLRAVDEE